jgi:isoquinoline 1-oxidoreductase beta subunit
MKPTRRALLQGGAGCAVAFFLPDRDDSTPQSFAPNAYIRIAANDAVTLCVTRSEMGQGVRTNLAATLADELDVDLAKVTLEQAVPGARFKGIRLRTSGSGSSSATFLALRRAGATARAMLIAAAAEQWEVPISTCRSEPGIVIHGPSGRRLTYGSLADAAARQAVPTNPSFKDTHELRYIGKPIRRIDAQAIVTGAAIYGIDARPPDTLVAVIRRCPHLDGKLRSFDAAKTLALPGVRHIVPISSGIFSGVAVVADNTWTAVKGCDALTIDWGRGANSSFESAPFIESLKAAGSRDGYPIRREGDAETVFHSAAIHLEATYEYPFQAHAPVEPMNCIADVRPDRCEVWAPSQTPETAQQNIIKTLGLPAEAVQVHTTLLGGGFDAVFLSTMLTRRWNSPKRSASLCR